MPRNAGNSFGLKRFEGNRPLSEQLTADRLNALIDMCEMNRVLYGKNTYGRRLPGGTTINAKAGGGTASKTSFPWHLYNTSTGSTGQVQVNGGDGQVAQLNGFVCNVNGDPSDTLISGAYPQLAITGNGFVYGYAVPTTAGFAAPLTSLDLFYAGTLPSPDTNNPAGYFAMLVATISNYDPNGRGTGMPSFDVNNVYGSVYGPSTLYYCNGGTLATY